MLLQMVVLLDDGQDTSCVGRREPANGSAPSDDVEGERADGTADSPRDADGQRGVAREDRWARCLNMVKILIVCVFFLWPMKKGAAKILTPFLEVEASSKAAQCNLTPTLWEKDRSYQSYSSSSMNNGH